MREKEKSGEGEGESPGDTSSFISYRWVSLVL
jgi:hypothetical protein